MLRKFSQKFHDFFDTVILKRQALGPVSHYLYKKEYQACGAPHYHILLWRDNAPVAGKDDDGIVLRWIVGESSLAIAHDVTGYVTKSEKSNMQDLWQEVSSHSSVYSKLWSLVFEACVPGNVVSMKPVISC